MPLLPGSPVCSLAYTAALAVYVVRPVQASRILLHSLVAISVLVRLRTSDPAAIEKLVPLATLAVELSATEPRNTPALAASQKDR